MTLIEKYIKSNHFGTLVGMDFTVIHAGKVEYRMRLTEQHLATPRAAHGGAIGALVDGALGVAALSAVYEENKVVSTVEYKINFISPAILDEVLVAYAHVDLKGKRLLIASCDVKVEGTQRLVAKAIGTFNSYDAEKAGY